MKFAVPFPFLKPAESVEKIFADYLPFRNHIEYFHIRIPYVEGRDSSIFGRLYADKCRKFIMLSKKRFKCVLDIKINASRPAINRYYRSQYIPEVLKKYGFDGILVRNVGNLAYFTENLTGIDKYYFINNLDNRMLGLLKGRATFAGLVVAGVGSLKKIADISGFGFNVGYIVNEACAGDCDYWQLMYSGRVGLDGFCKDCSKLKEHEPGFYFVPPDRLDDYCFNVDTVFVSGALRDSSWVRNTFLSYYYRKNIDLYKVLNGPFSDRFYER